MPLLRLLAALILLAATQAPIAHADDEQRREYLRVTFYTLNGCMADSGARCDVTEKGAAACSKWLPFGTILEFRDGFQVTCRDRGHGDWYWKGWVDVWAPSWQWGYDNIENPKTGGYGYYTWVTIIRWGWGDADA